jgi:DNA-binding response OmpR family regulator
MTETGPRALRRRVLIVEDEAPIRELMRLHLGLAGFDAVECATGTLALERARAEKFDLILLDVMLPGLDGITVCRAIRNQGVNTSTAILMVTARDTESDTVLGLESGADDYVVKPFGKQELVARIQALLRRAARGASSEAEAETYADSFVSIDWGQARVSVGDREVQLTPLEFRLLSTFVRHPRQVLSRDQLLELVWGDAFGVGGDQVKLYVGYLRRKLDPKEPDSVPIETVRGFGYRYKTP